jgi:hypothetical protein
VPPHELLEKKILQSVRRRLPRVSLVDEKFVGSGPCSRSSCPPPIDPARYFSEFFLLGCLPSWTDTSSAYPNPAPKWWLDMRTHLPLSRAPLLCCRSGLRYVSLPLSGVFRCARGSRDSLNLWRFFEPFLDRILLFPFVMLLPEPAFTTTCSVHKTQF